MFKLFTAKGLFLVLLGFAFLSSCSDKDNKNDPPPDPKSSDVSITAISVSLGGETYNVPVPAAGGKSALNIAKNISKSRKTTTVNITKGNAEATIKVGTKIFTNGDVLDFTNDVTFDVTAANGTLKTYTVSILGCGSKDNPCKVYTVKQLSEIREGLDDSYILMNNITLPDANADGVAATGISDYATKGWLPIAHDARSNYNNSKLIGEFKGSFNGAGFIIDNFYINRTGGYVGLFGATTGEIKNLGIKGITGSSPCVTASNNISGNCYVGILAGQAEGRIDNCYATGDVLCTGGKRTCSGGLIRSRMEY